MNRQPNATSFKPGAAWKGNKAGRPKSVLTLVVKARELCPEAIDKACELLRSDDEKVALAAAVFLRDTGMGRPSQVEFDIAQVTDDDLAAEIRRRAELRADEERQRERVEQSATPKPSLDA